MPGTIVALSTPAGQSGLAVMRVSGPECREVLQRHLRRAQPDNRRMCHGSFVDVAGETLDKLNYVFMEGPRTATGEDVLELFPHGNPLLISRILQSLLSNREMRLAEPGEFTRRGFENGKIDLIQAESIAQIVHAQNLSALRNAQKILSGGLSANLQKLKSRLLDLSMRLELDVDFSEEEADPDYGTWRGRIQEILEELERLAGSFEKGKMLERVPRIGLFGPPNAGKSSLINALLERDRLLVSELPGTTRDYVEVPFQLPGGMVQLVDTAGLGIPVDSLDNLAMEKTRSLFSNLDFKILLRDGTDSSSCSMDPLERDIEFDLKVSTKSDLPGYATLQGYLPLSSKTRQGLAELTRLLNDTLFGESPEEEGILISSERQYQALVLAAERVRAARNNLDGSPAIEILAFEIREACVCLKDLLGEITPDEVLKGIFSGFCIGK